MARATSNGRDAAEDQGDTLTAEVEIGRSWAARGNGRIRVPVIREIRIRLDEGDLPDRLGSGHIDRVLAQQAQKEINSHLKISP